LFETIIGSTKVKNSKKKSRKMDQKRVQIFLDFCLWSRIKFN